MGLHVKRASWRMKRLPEPLAHSNEPSRLLQCGAAIHVSGQGLDQVVSAYSTVHTCSDSSHGEEKSVEGVGRPSRLPAAVVSFYSTCKHLRLRPDEE